LLFDCVHNFVLYLVVLQQTEINVEFVDRLTHWIGLLKHAFEVIEYEYGPHVVVLEINTIQLIQQTALCQLLHDFVSLGRRPFLLGNEVDSAVNCMHLFFHVFWWLLLNNLLVIRSLMNLCWLAMGRQVGVALLDAVENLELINGPCRRRGSRAAVNAQEKEENDDEKEKQAEKDDGVETVQGL
jgi:hypothetical protein